jgi:reductive dehalogenase
MSLSKKIRNSTVTTLSKGEEAYQVDPEAFERFDQKNNLTIGRPNWDPGIQSATKLTSATRLRHLSREESGYGVEDYGLYFSGGVVSGSLGTNINESNSGLLSWHALRYSARKNRVFQDLPENQRTWRGTPSDGAKLIKQAARFFGADLVGIAPLDKRWIYSHAYWSDGKHKEILFKDVPAPEATEKELIIPETMKWVIVMAVKMDPDILGFAPSPIGSAETQNAYSKLAALTSRLAAFIRGLGYQAIPSMNDLGLSIPMAMDAGLGEQGRHGKLITPDFGPSVRLCKVLTDLPLERDYPIRFGVKAFCEICKKCAKHCPAKAIPFDGPRWEGPTISNNPGVHTWYLDNDACRKYWALGPGTNCSICLRTCPFTKKPELIHNLVRWTIAKLPKLNPLWLKFDDWLGYGVQKDADTFWG